MRFVHSANTYIIHKYIHVMYVYVAILARILCLSLVMYANGAHSF